MDGHIDWLSFTLETKETIPSIKHLAELARRLVRKQSEELYVYLYRGQAWDNGVGRPPFRYALARGDRGVRIYGGGQLPIVLFEISGKGCERMREGDIARTLASAVRGRVTRVDYACDVRTATTPSNFGAKRSNQAFRATSLIKSDTGETLYVGSPKSDRFCRVYRYARPHPRHALLRVEFVFRRGMATSAIEAYLSSKTNAEFQAQLGNTWGFTHPVWQPGDETDERVKAPLVTRENEQTVLWLYKQVAPALRKVYDQGAIDLEDWWGAVFGVAAADDGSTAPSA